MSMHTGELVTWKGDSHTEMLLMETETGGHERGWEESTWCLSQIRAPVFKAHWPHLPLTATMRCFALRGARVLIRQWESKPCISQGGVRFCTPNPGTTPGTLLVLGDANTLPSSHCPLTEEPEELVNEIAKQTFAERMHFTHLYGISHAYHMLMKPLIHLSEGGRN